jgi:hypothetical protein
LDQGTGGANVNGMLTAIPKSGDSDVNPKLTAASMDRLRPKP